MFEIVSIIKNMIMCKCVWIVHKKILMTAITINLFIFKVKKYYLCTFSKRCLG